MPPTLILHVAPLLVGTAVCHRLDAAAPQALLEVVQGLPPWQALAPLLAASASSALAPPQAAARRAGALWAGGGGTWDAATERQAASRGTPFDEPEPHGSVEDAGPRLTEFPAKVLGVDESEGDAWRDIALPPDWAWELDPGSVHFIPGAKDANPKMIGLARWASNVDVKFGAWRSGDDTTKRHLRLSEMLSNSGIAPKILDVRAYPKETFVLTKSPGMRTVASLLSEQKGVLLGEPVVPLDVALPLMVEMLQSLTVMESLGIAHGDITESNIYIVNGTHMRTVFDDYRHACVPNSEDDEVSCLGLAGVLCGSAFRHAPEMIHGIPNHVANNVWQLGIVFANLMLREVLPTWLGHALSDNVALDRLAIREFMRESFSISDDVAFLHAQIRYGDVMGVVAGMLEKDPKHRSTPEEATKQLLQVAATRGIALPSERLPQDFVPERSKQYFQADGI